MPRSLLKKRLHFSITVLGLLALCSPSFAECPADEELVWEDEKAWHCKTKAGFSGNWTEPERRVVETCVRGLRDREISNWIGTGLAINRFKDDAISPVTAFGSTLRIKDGFFKLSRGEQDNLLTFEAGKVYWNIMKDRPLQGGQTLLSWFTSFSGKNASVIADMKATKHRGRDLSQLVDLVDMPSSFGHLFRGQALHLRAPSSADQKKWSAVLKEFSVTVNPFMKGN